jgi:23S rRNA pseudouridine1911/1915/1917 synthase
VPPIQFAVDRRAANQTLAAALKARLGLSWARAKRLVENGHVKVSGQVERDGTRRLKLGKRVEVAAGAVELTPEQRAAVAADKKKADERKGKTAAKKSPADAAPRPGSPKAPPRRTEAAPPSRPSAPALDPDAIVYQDDAIAVVNKPVGLTTVRHADEAAEFGEHGRRFLPKTLADLLPAALGAPDRPVTAVHRLDRDTSGLVVFARTRAAAENLLQQFRRHTTERRYLALTRGVPAAKRIESVFVRDRGDGRRGSSADLVPTDGKRAVTRVSVLETFGRFALVECRLETGRTHQVRIHLGEAGTPLCGESVYDRPADGKPAADGSGADRPMLHAARLGLAHPETGAVVSWEVAPPEDFRAVLAALKGRGA